MKKKYIFTISLHTEDPTPSYQVTRTLEGQGKHFRLPSHKMPLAFEKGDTLGFKIDGRDIWNCTLYFKPLNFKSLKIPFRACSSVGEDVDGFSDRWQIHLWKKGEKKVDHIEIIESNGVWDFTIAGTFEANIVGDGDDTGQPKGKVKGKQKFKNVRVLMPFIVDPECVVGERDS